MKKFILCFCIIVFAISLVSCSKEKTAKDIAIEIGQTTKFSKDEIEDAVKCVENNFSFKSSTLTKIWYDEAKSDSYVEDYLQYEYGLENKTDPKNVIVLLSDFEVDDSGDNSVLNINSTYSGYHWILKREDENSDWVIDDSRY